MTTAYQNPLEAQTSLTSAFNPTNQAQTDAIARASALVPTITATSLTPTPTITVPPPAPDTTNHNASIAGGNAAIDSTSQAILDEYKKNNPTVDTSSLSYLLNSAVTTPDNTAAYDTATGTTTASRQTALDTATTEAAARKSAVRAAQAEVAGIQAQIQSITDQRDKQNLQLEQSINQGTTGAGGSGALASGSFLNTRQQEINRQAAISALPLQGLALAAQAKLLGLQGLSADAADTLTAAQKKFDDAFTLKINDNNRLYDAQKENRKAIYDFLTAAQKAQADAIDKKQSANLSTANAAINDANGYASNLLATQPQLAGEINGLAHPSPTSKTFEADLKTYNDKVAAILKRVTPKASATGGDGLLSVSEAQALGVPYGTSKSQAMGANITPTKQATAAQETTALYANRIEQSNAIISQLDNKVAGMNPLAFSGQQALPQWLNGVKSADFQSVDQAQRNFVNAVLRRESGAVISPQEFDNARQQYFTMPGDVPATIAQKKANRDLVQQGFVSGAGQAYTPMVATGGVLKSPDGTQQVNTSELTPTQIQEAKDAGWK